MAESIQTPVVERYAAPATSRGDARVRGRGIARRLAGGLALCALFCLTAELTCRLEDWLRFGTPFFTKITSQADLMIRDADGIHGRPNARYQKWSMNALGTRGPAATLAKPDATLRVVLLGASETFGLYESPGKEFARQLEDSLNALLVARGCTRRRFEVLNAALPGMSLPTIEQDLRNRVRRFGADVIVLYPTPAQYLVDEPPQPAAPDSSGRASLLSPRGALHSRVVDRLRAQLKELLPDVVATWLRRRDTEAQLRDKPANWRFASPPADRLALYDADLRQVIGTIRASRATPILMTHANRFMHAGPADRGMLVAWEKFYPRAPGSVIVAFDAEARDVTLRAAADSSVVVADVARQLARARASDVFADFSHFTDAGSAVVASALVSPVLSSALHGPDCGEE